MQETWTGLKTVSTYIRKKVDSEVEFDIDKPNEFYARFDVKDNRY